MSNTNEKTKPAATMRERIRRAAAGGCPECGEINSALIGEQHSPDSLSRRVFRCCRGCDTEWDEMYRMVATDIRITRLCGYPLGDPDE